MWYSGLLSNVWLGAVLFVQKVDSVKEISVDCPPTQSAQSILELGLPNSKNSYVHDLIHIKLQIQKAQEVPLPNEYSDF